MSKKDEHPELCKPDAACVLAVIVLRAVSFEWLVLELSFIYLLQQTSCITLSADLSAEV